MKEMWFRFYVEALDDGHGEDEAADIAFERVRDELANMADNARKAAKEG